MDNFFTRGFEDDDGQTTKKYVPKYKKQKEQEQIYQQQQYEQQQQYQQESYQQQQYQQEDYQQQYQQDYYQQPQYDQQQQYQQDYYQQQQYEQNYYQQPEPQPKKAKKNMFDFENEVAAEIDGTDYVKRNKKPATIQYSEKILKKSDNLTNFNRKNHSEGNKHIINAML